MQAKSTENLVKTFDMRVAAKILQSIASGIYRTPANAIKELLSNSFDADATKVDVNIDIDQLSRLVHRITVTDNGVGINTDDFEYSLTHIGASIKKLEGELTSRDRPIVGRIGIGLLSAGQASNTFSFISAPQDEDYTMRAEVNLSPYYDKIKMYETLDKLTIGNVKVFQEDRKSSKTFTQIILCDIKEPFSRELAVEASDPNYSFDFAKASSYKEFIDWIDRKQIKRLEYISGYGRFIFELGLLTPVRYLAGGPIRGYENSRVIRRINDRLSSFNFRVFVNGMEIFKPILLPHISDNLQKKGEDYKLYEIEVDEKLPDGRKLKALGYYYHQIKRLVPWILRGVMLRVKNIGIGGYENAFSKIYAASPIILHQLTAELYVDEGLDQSLNIDRNSFFESDEAYQTLWKEVFKRVNPEHLPEVLAREIVPEAIPKTSIGHDIRKRLDKRQEVKRREREFQWTQTVSGAVNDMLKQVGYPSLVSDGLKFRIRTKEIPRAMIHPKAEGTSVEVILHRRFSEPVRGTLVITLIAAQLAMQEAKVSPQRFIEKLGELLRSVEL